ncbi:hypothetical protein MF672_038850 [Actinomadura sp. ATCC 31491]|uniref:DNA-binding protein n=1 Tax=Actinomadura luzonensis TaxID=2805427 RepID=A0ABT0G525_9ACTN|nr:hypothetical protein [Actinomadura luzonensis]MCK2219713.1 hypothetical protein [Actinomadura luzonensis]
MRPRPVTAAQAAAELTKRPGQPRAVGTIYSWATRYNVRRWANDQVTLYDYNDLATIDGCIRRGEPVPATPDERDQLREQLRTRWAA